MGKVRRLWAAESVAGREGGSGGVWRDRMHCFVEEFFDEAGVDFRAVTVVDGDFGRAEEVDHGLDEAVNFGSGVL